MPETDMSLDHDPATLPCCVLVSRDADGNLQPCGAPGRAFMAAPSDSGELLAIVRCQRHEAIWREASAIAAAQREEDAARLRARPRWLRWLLA